MGKSSPRSRASRKGALAGAASREADYEIVVRLANDRIDRLPAMAVELVQEGVRAICAVSPALWSSSGAAAPGAFDGPEDFAANSVAGLPALASIPIRIDCGYSDPFFAATKAFIAQLPTPPAGGFSPGGHDSAYWSSQLPAEIGWLAPLLTA